MLLKFDHLTHAEFESADGGQQLRLFFATHDVVIRGHSLRRVEIALQRQELSFVAAVPTAYRATIPDGQPIVREIVVTEAAEVESHASPTGK